MEAILWHASSPPIPPFPPPAALKYGTHITTSQLIHKCSLDEISSIKDMATPTAKWCKVAATMDCVNHHVFHIKVACTLNTFVTAFKDQPGRITDSIVHQYMHTVGFKLAMKEDEGGIRTNVDARDAHKTGVVIARNDNPSITSHQSNFECFLLEHLHCMEYHHSWLLSLADQFDSDGQLKKMDRKNVITFHAPSLLTISS
eukprot:scaffold29628_cov72-Attheya_sp.AAC.1